jgi:hypothetical protein
MIPIFLQKEIFIMGNIIFYDSGIYDDRLLVKPVKAAIAYMPTASYELPYDGAKEIQTCPGYVKTMFRKEKKNGF